MYIHALYYTYIMLLLAELHFNENFDREQARTATDSEQIKIAFPKQENLSQNQYLFQNLTVCLYVYIAFLTYHLTLGYVDTLMKKAIQFCLKDNNKPPLSTTPPSLASAYTHPDKDTIPQFSRYKHYLI